MDRRAFLRALLAGAAGAALGAELDIERLLWVPKPIISVPAMPVAADFVFTDWLTQEYLELLKKTLVMAPTFNPEYLFAADAGPMTIRIPRGFAA